MSYFLPSGRFSVEPDRTSGWKRFDFRDNGKMDIEYKDNASYTIDEMINLYRRSTLGERRPLDRPDIFRKMRDCANLVVTAWDGNRLVGIARSFTDFGYVAYLADLAVDSAYQKKGIGKRLVGETRARLEPTCKIVLLAAPKANDYYPHIGFSHTPRAWVLKGDIAFTSD